MNIHLLTFLLNPKNELVEKMVDYRIIDLPLLKINADAEASRVAIKIPTEIYADLNTLREGLQKLLGGHVSFGQAIKSILSAHFKVVELNKQLMESQEYLKKVLEISLSRGPATIITQAGGTYASSGTPQASSTEQTPPRSVTSLSPGGEKPSGPQDIKTQMVSELRDILKRRGETGIGILSENDAVFWRRIQGDLPRFIKELAEYPILATALTDLEGKIKAILEFGEQRYFEFLKKLGDINKKTGEKYVPKALTMQKQVIEKEQVVKKEQVETQIDAITVLFTSLNYHFPEITGIQEKLRKQQASLAAEESLIKQQREELSSYLQKKQLTEESYKKIIEDLKKKKSITDPEQQQLLKEQPEYAKKLASIKIYEINTKRIKKDLGETQKAIESRPEHLKKNQEEYAIIIRDFMKQIDKEIKDLKKEAETINIQLRESLTQIQTINKILEELSAKKSATGAELTPSEEEYIRIFKGAAKNLADLEVSGKAPMLLKSLNKFWSKTPEVLAKYLQFLEEKQLIFLDNQQAADINQYVKEISKASKDYLESITQPEKRLVPPAGSPPPQSRQVVDIQITSPLPVPIQPPPPPSSVKKESDGTEVIVSYLYSPEEVELLLRVLNLMQARVEGILFTSPE